MTSAHDLQASRTERLRLAKRVEHRLQGDEHRLRLLDACYDHVSLDPDRTVRGDLRDVYTLLSLARGVRLA